MRSFPLSCVCGFETAPGAYVPANFPPCRHRPSSQRPSECLAQWSLEGATFLGDPTKIVVSLLGFSSNYQKRGTLGHPQKQATHLKRRFLWRYGVGSLQIAPGTTIQMYLHLNVSALSARSTWGRRASKAPSSCSYVAAVGFLVRRKSSLEHLFQPVFCTRWIKMLGAGINQACSRRSVAFPRTGTVKCDT